MRGAVLYDQRREGARYWMDIWTLPAVCWMRARDDDCIYGTPTPVQPSCPTTTTCCNRNYPPLRCWGTQLSRPTEQGLVVDRCNKLFVPPSLRLHTAIQPYLPMRGALFAADSSPGTTAPLVSSIRSSAPLKRGIQLQQLRGRPVSHERRRNGPPTSCVALLPRVVSAGNPENSFSLKRTC